MKQGHFPFGTLNNGFCHVISKELYYFIASMDVGLVWYSFEILCVGLLSSFMFQILQILSQFSSRNSNSLPSFFLQRLEIRQYFFFENPTLLEANCTSDLTWIGPWHSLSSRLPKFVKHFYFSLCLQSWSHPSSIWFAKIRFEEIHLPAEFYIAVVKIRNYLCLRLDYLNWRKWK